MKKDNQAYILRAAIYFFLSTVITWWFIKASPLYISTWQQLLSCGIAGGKWGLQILAALLFLAEKKWLLISRIGFTCLIGSLILLPYSCNLLVPFAPGAPFFLGSLVVSVLAMIVSYYSSVRGAGLPLKWWFSWLGSLAVAVTLQLTVVFHVIHF